MDRLTQRGAVERLTGGIEADILHHRGSGIGIVAASRHTGDIGAGQIQRQQLDLVGIEGIDHRIRVAAVQQLNPLQRQCFLLPPVAVDTQIGAVVRLPTVGAGAGGNQFALCAGLDNGDIQPCRETAVVLRQRDRYRVAVLGIQAVHHGQPRPVPLTAAGALQRVRHIVGAQTAAVAKADVAAHLYGVGEGVRIIGVAPGQYVLHGELLVQGKQALIQQSAQR